MPRQRLRTWTLLVLAAATLGALGLSRAAPSTSTSTATSTSGQLSKAVERGGYLVKAGGCGDCHSPKIPSEVGLVPDSTRLLSGHPSLPRLPPAPRIDGGPWIVVGLATGTAWAGPWGTSFSSNLTPDKDTGMGRWIDRLFIDAMRTGRHMGQGRLILPPMPVQAIGQFNDEDLSSIFAYLQSLPAIRNFVPDPLAAPE